MITQSELQQILTYDSITGIFVWKKCAYNRQKELGTIAGGASDRYWRISINGKRYYGHQLAWLYIYGEWPDEIDHKDLVKTNNAIHNLRVCTRSQNNVNKIVTNKFGRGVQKRTENCYSARIKVEGRLIRLGHYNTAGEARAAYIEAAKKYHQEFARF